MDRTASLKRVLNKKVEEKILKSKYGQKEIISPITGQEKPKELKNLAIHQRQKIDQL